ncbi:hypothetical protein FBQ82_15805 [Anaerolineae bacterium CFX7]|nr:hypothetical protein [Anaerolineae bacterium CFX7]
MDSAPQNLDVQELAQQLCVKALELSDLDVMLEDYQRERAQLIQEINKLKALLWEHAGDAQALARLGITDASLLPPPAGNL